MLGAGKKSMTFADTQSEIRHCLECAERDHRVRVVLALESGSRAWGFPSPDSDYDVRFVYAHPADWYLSVDLEERSDVIETTLPGDIDLVGWDLRKSLRLFWKSNPTFVEWIQSPLIYIDRGTFRRSALHLLPRLYSCESGIHHYRNMASTNFRGYLRADTVPLKKYFYVLRPLLAIRWLEKHGCAPPTRFHDLLGLLADQPELVTDVERLLALKQKTHELGVATQIPTINAFIERELERIAVIIPTKTVRTDPLAELNALFHSTLRETWSE